MKSLMDSFVYCLLLFMPDIKETKNTFFQNVFYSIKIIKQVKKSQTLVSHFFMMIDPIVNLYHLNFMYPHIWCLLCRSAMYEELQ